jgi:hypothetical protein
MDSIYPLSTSEIAHKRRDLTPNQQAAFDAFGKAVFADGALSAKPKQIIAVAVAHVNWPPSAARHARTTSGKQAAQIAIPLFD